MAPVRIKPSPRLRSKLRLQTWIFLGLQLLWSVPVALLIGNDVNGATGALIGLLIVFLLNALWFIPALWLVDRYYDSIQYELGADEIIVQVGIWTRSIKHVPFRTITNITLRRDLFDRYLFNIGTLDVQTAGASGQQAGAEESLMGLVDFEAAYDMVAQALQKYRGLPLAANQAGSELPTSLGPNSDAVMTALLEEVRAIRTFLGERRNE